MKKKFLFLVCFLGIITFTNAQNNCLNIEGTDVRVSSNASNSRFNTSSTNSSTSYTYTGSEQSWVVPAGIIEITVKAWGAGGGGSYGPTYSNYGGASGGFAQGTFTVIPGETLIIAVGGGGKSSLEGNPGGDGGWPGGGYGTYLSVLSGSGGGGYSGIFLESSSHSNTLIIAGAGGGGGYTSFNSGAGGGESGNNGLGASGGTQDAGGAGYENGADGSALQGGNGDSRGQQDSGNTLGGGGGGGYYGGEGGFHPYGGAGGSAFFHPGRIDGSGTLTVGTNGATGNVPPPNTDDQDYITGVGVGGKASDGGNGLIVIEYVLPGPMEYTSSTTETYTSEDIYAPSMQNAIVRLLVETSGSLNPLSVSSITFNTNGTSNVSDLNNAHIYYTSTTTFSNSVSFGSVVSNPNGAMIFTGNQELAMGTNYFWLTYDVSSGATLGNIVDGECNSVTVDALARTPTIQAPAGSRTIASNPFSGGSGTTANPFHITSKNDLKYLSEHSDLWSKHFIQTADITFLDSDFEAGGDFYNSGSGFIPIGNTTPFTGSYNGDGHLIDNLFISRSDYYQAFFGHITGATIEKLGIINAEVFGNDLAACLAGKASTSSTIRYCYSTGSVQGASNLGGLVGFNESSNIENCYSTASVQSYSPTSYAGGISGNNSNSIVSYSFCTGAIAGNSYIGGISGGSLNSTILNCYWDTETSGQSSSVGGLGKTTAEMQMEGTYENWDFGNESLDIWVIDPYSSSAYPSLFWEGYNHYAVEASGDGSVDNPYQISTLTRLFWLSQNSSEWPKYFEQTENINAFVTQGWFGGAGFLPIGNSDNSFSGNYDGQNHCITSLKINRPTEERIGIFSETDGASIQNLGLELSAITGGNIVGGIVGFNKNTTIQNCYRKQGYNSGNNTVGGIAGVNTTDGVITQCYNTATITATVSTSGGICGSNSAPTITELGGTISFCYNTGTISGTDYIGGICGYSFGIGSYLINCYNRGNISGTNYIGGIAGYHQYYAELTNCYSTGWISGSTYTGGLVGERVSPSYINNSYYDTQTSGQSESSTYARKTRYMKLQSNYYLWDFDNETTNGSNDYWCFNPNINDGYPFLWWQESSHYPESPSGSGTSGDPYQILSLNNLYWISLDETRWTQYYNQTADIDASSTSGWNADEGFLPIGIEEDDYYDYFFGGNYDGQHYKIDQLYINSEEDNIGLFGYAEECTCSNISLSNSNITGEDYTGGLMGYGKDPTVSECYVSGSIHGNDNIGGLIGYIYGWTHSISNSYNTASVSGNNYVGGLVSEYNGTINNCYSAGAVSANDFAGGLVYSHTYGTVSNSFWDINASLQTSSAAGTGKTTAEMKTQSTFTDWDFNTIWSLSAGYNNGYPNLEGYISDSWTGSANTDWANADNWNSGYVPGADDNITILDVENDPIISSITNASCNNLTVLNYAILTIKSNATGTGSLIVNGTASGDITVERYLSQGKWHYISAPVNDTRVFNTFLNLTAGANNDQFYWWDEDGTYNGYTGIWFDILNDPTGISYTENSFLPSQAYAITYAGTGSETINFNGVPYTENRTITITKTDAGTNPGANLVGNPFCSTIAITTSAQTTNNFIAQNSSVLRDDAQAVYYWDESQNDYETKNNASGAIYADPGQGFIVMAKSASESLELNVSTRKHGTSTFFKNSNSDDISRIEIIVNCLNNTSNSTSIAFLPDMTFGLDPSYDAAKLKGNPDIALYTKLVEDNGVDFAIQALPPLNTEKLEVKIGLDVNNAGSYNLKIKELQNFDEAISIKLEDKETGSLIDLRQIEEYLFNVNQTGQIRERFVLHFNNATGIEDQPQIQSNFQAWAANKTIHILNPENQKGTIRIINIYGQELDKYKLNGDQQQSFTINAPTGYYVVSISGKEFSVNKKVLIK